MWSSIKTFVIYFFSPKRAVSDLVVPDIKELQRDNKLMKAEIDYLRNYLDRRVNRKMYRIAKNELSPFYFEKGK